MLIGGTTGVGKSTLATMLAARLGVNRVIATDVIRQVLRAFFTIEAMPTVHHSAFEAGGVTGYRDQAERVGTAIAAIVERAADEGEAGGGGGGARGAGRRASARARALRAGGGARGRGRRRPPPRRTSRCGPARGRPSATWRASTTSAALQDHLWARARSEGVAIVDNENVDGALARLMELVLDAVREDVK